jgi:hypothetical protein
MIEEIIIVEPIQQPDVFNRAIIAYGDGFEVCLNSMGHYWTMLKNNVRLSSEMQKNINDIIDKDVLIRR